MLETALFGMVMLAVGWLVIWFATDRSKPSNTWWPFDYRESEKANAAADEAKPKAAVQRVRQNPTRPWKRSGF